MGPAARTAADRPATPLPRTSRSSSAVTAGGRYDEREAAAPFGRGRSGAVAAEQAVEEGLVGPQGRAVDDVEELDR